MLSTSKLMISESGKLKIMLTLYVELHPKPEHFQYLTSIGCYQFVFDFVEK